MTPLHRFAASALACLGLVAAHSAPAAVVTAGKHFLTPNASSQFIAITVAGGDLVEGVDLFLQIGDGGAAAGGDDVGPTITGVDFGGNGIFATNNSGVLFDPTPMLWGATTTTLSGKVAANGRLALVAINATGIMSGRYDLILNPALTGPSVFPSVATTLVNGWINVGPPQEADFNEDGGVDALDLTAWRGGFGTTAAATHAQGNADGDQDVDGRDFLVWQRQLGLPAPASAIPEPHAWILALLGVAPCRRRA